MPFATECPSCGWFVRHRRDSRRGNLPYVQCNNCGATGLREVPEDVAADGIEARRRQAKEAAS